jgi:hypothetical protein
MPDFSALHTLLQEQAAQHHRLEALKADPSARERFCARIPLEMVKQYPLTELHQAMAASLHYVPLELGHYDA